MVYDAFGNITEATGQSANKFGYTGHQMDAETGLVYFQARYYDPQLGRFITQDPYEGDWRTPLSLHHYLYAYANPTVYVDLFGYQNSRSACFSQNPDDCMSSDAKQERTANREGYDRAERAKGTKRFKDSRGNNFDEVQRDRTVTADLTTENAEGGVDVAEMTPGQRQYKEAHDIGVAAGEYGGAILEATGPDRYSFFGGVAAKAGVRVIKFSGGALVKGAKAGLRILNKGAQERRLEQAIVAEEKLAAKGLTGEAEHIRAPRHTVEAKPQRIRCRSCFVAGTPVAVQGGFKAIEDVREGDLVLSKSEATGELAYKPVVKLIVTQNKGVFDLTLRSANGESEVLTVTDNHPFWVLNKGSFTQGVEVAGWVESGELKAGMLVLSSEGKELLVESLRDKQESPDTYNLTVADFHTYFVGKLRSWVHNDDCYESAKRKRLEVGKVESYEDSKKLTGDGTVDRDHMPSKGALLVRAEYLKGEPLTYEEKTRIINESITMTVPNPVHKAGPTHGYKNNAAQMQGDACNLAGAACRDADAAVQNAHVLAPNDVGAIEAGAAKIKGMTNDAYDRWLRERIDIH